MSHPHETTDSSATPAVEASSGRHGAALERLVAVMARLRDPERGCPWDLEQDLRSLRPYLIEEAYEVLEAIDEGDPQEHRKELGDLLLQVVFQARLREEEGLFGFADVADAISDKMISRHPHVFGELKLQGGSDEVLTNWARQKEAERKAAGQERPSALDGVPRALPALVRSERLGEKASRVGFDWSAAADVRAKVTEELAEVDEAVAAGDAAQVAEELGDLLFAVAQWTRKLGQHPEDVLREAAAKFERRFRQVEQLAHERGSRVDALDAAALDGLWNEAKRTR